ncbi:MAG: glycosyltransferase family 4 protein [Verrucomicrobiaceae bacterium]|nr:glycosyltransferase family 4 protein [Verrucomicrobiaceae bacterium]
MHAARRRVLILVENLPVPLDRRVWQEACTLRDAGYDVTVICPRMRGFTRAEEVLDGIQIYRHWISGEAKTTAGFLLEYTTALIGGLVCALKAWSRHGRFDIIHLCNPPDLLFLVALPFKLLGGARVLFDAHDLWPEMFEAKFGALGLLYRAVCLAERCTLALADVVIATNESVRAALMRRGRLHDDAVFVVRTAPVNLDTAAPPDDSLRRGKAHLVGYIGVLGGSDGVDYLLEAAHHLVHTRRRHDIHFLLMGGGPEFDALVKKRDQLGLQEHVSMPGLVSDAFLCSALRSIDLGVACDPINAYNDCCTMNKVLEYMAFARPMVMFGTVEGRYSAGEAAAYVMENDAAQFAEAISALLDDPARRAQMGRAGHQRLTTELNWERSAQCLRAAYARCLSS